MKVLWICNRMPAMFAQATGLKRSNMEGWVTGALETLLAHCREDGIQLGVAFPVRHEENTHGRVRGVEYFGFVENTSHPEEYDPALTAALGLICEDFHPDVIHVFGTEYPHTLAMMRVSEWKNRAVVHLQGLMSLCAEEYYGGLGDDVTGRVTLRDIIRKDSLVSQKEKYEQRAFNEEQALKLADHVLGRTDLDKAFFVRIHPDADYFSFAETLRSCFYEGAWTYEDCEKHTIFMPQGDIPLKGAHIMIEALAIVRKKYPDARLRIAGDRAVKGGIFAGFVQGRYGEYLSGLIRKKDLKDSVKFIGQLRDTQMKEYYLSSHVFVLPSFIENSSNSLGEAMLLGMPCVASRVGGIPSMASEEELRFVSPGDPEELAKAVCAIFDDEENTLKLAAAGRKRAMLSFDREANYKMLKWIYESVIKDSK